MLYLIIFCHGYYSQKMVCVCYGLYLFSNFLYLYDCCFPMYLKIKPKECVAEISVASSASSRKVLRFFMSEILHLCACEKIICCLAQSMSS